MKKVKVIAVLLLMCIAPIVVMGYGYNNLIDQEAYYSNDNGVVLSKQQYDNLKKVFSDTDLESLNIEIADLLKNDDTLEYVSYPQDLCEKSTGYKDLEISVIAGRDESIRIVKLTCDWKRMPVVRSYDIMGIRSAGYGYLISAAGYQNYDNKIIYYDDTKENFKASNNGVGIIMNLKDDMKKSLSCNIIAAFEIIDFPEMFYGAYEHATKETEFQEVEQFELLELGMGKVIRHKDARIGDKYDNMAGVQIRVAGHLEDVYSYLPNSWELRTTPIENELDMIHMMPVDYIEKGNDAYEESFGYTDEKTDITLRYYDYRRIPEIPDRILINGKEYDFTCDAGAPTAKEEYPELTIQDINRDGYSDYLLRSDGYNEFICNAIYISSGDEYITLENIVDNEYSYSATYEDGYKLHVVAPQWNIDEVVDITTLNYKHYVLANGIYDATGKVTEYGKSITLSSLRPLSLRYMTDSEGTVYVQYEAQICEEYRNRYAGSYFAIQYNIGANGYEFRGVTLNNCSD